MKVRFIGSGEPGEDEVCHVFDHDFPIGKTVTLPAHFAFRHKLEGNPAFEVVHERAKKAAN